MTSAHTLEKRRARWLAYLAEREHSYAYYCAQRYDPVITEMVALGLETGDLVYDLGAGMGEFGHRLVELGYRVRYVPVDGAIDGTYLEYWTPPITADFFVCIETIEHLPKAHGLRLLGKIEAKATKGCVLTTPNPEVVDVAALDQTHASEYRPAELEERGWSTRRFAMYGNHGDSVLAVWKAHR
jgi:2-polyprenyl-3-methyl-5-hydroxy-6-metoxy-1,4-benzoquinol methylase